VSARTLLLRLQLLPATSRPTVAMVRRRTHHPAALAAARHGGERLRSAPVVARRGDDWPLLLLPPPHVATFSPPIRFLLGMKDAAALGNSIWSRGGGNRARRRPAQSAVGGGCAGASARAARRRRPSAAYAKVSPYKSTNHNLQIMLHCSDLPIILVILRRSQFTKPGS
jgi:hypothetical protein